MELYRSLLITPCQLYVKNAIQFALALLTPRLFSYEWANKMVPSFQQREFIYLLLARSTCKQLVHLYLILSMCRFPLLCCQTFSVNKFLWAWTPWAAQVKARWNCGISFDVHGTERTKYILLENFYPVSSGPSARTVLATCWVVFLSSTRIALILLQEEQIVLIGWGGCDVKKQHRRPLVE